MAKMKLCVVNIHIQHVLTQENEQKMYVVQPKSLPLVMECLEGLVKLGRAKLISMDQIQAMTEIGKLVGGKPDGGD